MTDQTSGFDIAHQQDLAKQEDSGTEVHIESIDGDPLYYGDDHAPVTITVAGSNSSRFRRAEEALRKRKLKPRQFTAAQLHDDQIEKVVACTLGWAGFLSNGEEVPFSPHNVRMLYRTCPWVLDQVIEAMNDHERFFKKG